MDGVTYCRVSSKEQAEGTSLETQEQACREYARTKRINILKVFVEQGESAKFADRTQLLELLDFCQKNKGKIQVLLVWKIDRFARNVADHFSIKATLLKYGVRIVSVTEPIDPNPEGKLMETILAGFAEFDNEIRAMRCVQGMRKKLQEGLFPWGPPLGYRSANTSGEKKTKPDQPDQPVFNLLQKAWREFATGGYTKAEMRRLMAAWGIATRKAQAMSAQSLDHFFQNKYYCGILVDPWTGAEYEGQHVPMVSREEFARVQQLIARRNHSIPHQKSRPEFPLRGVVRCNSCQRYMTGGFSRGRTRRYPYYRCPNRQCKIRNKGYPAQAVRQEFESLLQMIAPKPEVLQKIEEHLISVAEQRSSFLKSKKARVEGEVKKLNKQLQELIRIKAESLITDKEFVEQRALLWERRNALEAKPIRDDLTPECVREWREELKEPLIRLPDTWAALPVDYQRRFNRFVVPVGYINGKNRTAELGPIFKLIDDFSEGNTDGVDLGRFELPTPRMQTECSGR